MKKLEFSNASKRSANAILSLSEIEGIIADERISQNINDEALGKLISSFLWKEKELNRNIFIRKYWFFDSVSDISQRYSVSESNVKSILFRTRNRLKVFLMKEGIEI